MLSCFSTLQFTLETPNRWIKLVEGEYTKGMWPSNCLFRLLHFMLLLLYQDEYQRLTSEEEEGWAQLRRQPHASQLSPGAADSSVTPCPVQQGGVSARPPVPSHTALARSLLPGYLAMLRCR